MYEYLDLLSRKLDSAQKDVCCRTENTIVAAGAGSGKTQVLATRFAWLVISKNVPASEILTLTFTKKAAAEMYSRIYETLKMFSENPETPEKEKENAKRAVESFSEVHIQTLDSYCTSVVRQCANRYGIRPDFTSGGSSEIGLKALQFVLKHKNNKAIRYFSANTDLQSFASLYFDKIITEYLSLADSDNFFTENLEKQRKTAAENWNSFIQKLTQSCRDIESFIDEAGKEASDEYFVNLKNVIDDESVEFFEIKDPLFIETDSRISEAAGKVLDWFYRLTNISTLKRKGLFKTVRDYMSVLRESKEFYGAVGGFIREYGHIKQMCELLDLFGKEVNESKRISGNLTFNDVIKMSLKILREQKDILIQERNAYSKIMIDEFQDNNGLNRDLLFLLSTEEDGTLNKYKLFFVGDEKQSIYKFRGADVSVFNRLKDDLQTQLLQMKNNYRSTNELLTSFNLMFSKVFDEKAEEDFEASFPIEAWAKKVDYVTHQEIPEAVLTAENVNGHVCMLNSAFLKNDVEDVFLSKEDQLAYFIARKIKEIYEKEKAQGAKYSDFACLDRSRTHRESLLRWLNRFGIPYHLDQQSSIFADAPVNDIYNLLRLCVYPSDEEAFAAFLTSPFTGLTHEEAETVLSVLAWQGAGSEESGHFEAFLEQDEPKVEAVFKKEGFEEEVTAKYKRAGEFYRNKRSKFLSQNISETLNEVWYETGYYYETLRNFNVRLLAEQYDMLFQFACIVDQQSKNLAYFVDQLSNIKQTESKAGFADDDIEVDLSSIEYPLERSDAVEIMTIHKSKGLQFKHVFISGCTGQLKASSEGAYAFSDEYGLSLRPLSSRNFFFVLKKAEDEAKQKAEFKRVLYVAVTRAEKDFYILGDWECNSTENEQIVKNQINTYYENAQEADEETVGIVRFEEGAPFDYLSIKPVTKTEAYETKIEEETFSEKMRKAENLYSGKACVEYVWPQSIRKKPSSLEKNYVEDEAFDEDSGSKYEQTEEEKQERSEFTAADFGTLVHKFLECQANGIDAETYNPEAKYFKNLSENEIASKKAECRKMCRRFDESPDGKSFQNARKAGRFYKAEWGFRMYDGTNLFTGSMDLIFKNEDGTYTIVDYKSDSEIIPEKYVEQQACYKKAASKMLEEPEEKIKCRLYFLKHDKQIELDI